MKFPEHYRKQAMPPYNTQEGDPCGLFVFRRNNNLIRCIATDGTDGEGEEADWEHVSVSVATPTHTRTPTWEEMCIVKGLFWDDEECVVQFHPPASQYVNQHPHVLHLWRSKTQSFPTPPIRCV